MALMISFGSFVAIYWLLLLPIATKGDGLPPTLSPFLENLCNEVECGRGSCEVGSGYPFNFRCNCDDGWRRTRSLDRDDDEHLFEFLPCIVPNCSVDYSCMPTAATPPPAPATPPHNSSSFFDPCNWIYCGEGRCMKNNGTRRRTHTCECSPGFSNLLNISAFPCYTDCAIGSESCERLGIRAGRRSTTTTTSNSPSNTSQAAAITVSLGKINKWMSILLATGAMVFLD